ncbi:MAG: hypothetical protein QXW33_05530 [Candidatus Bathyarchaeia archaeon]
MALRGGLRGIGGLLLASATMVKWLSDHLFSLGLSVARSTSTRITP